MADLITLADYKTLEGITSTQHDARTEVIIDSVSQLVKTYCGNSIIDFFTDDKVETLTINYDIDQIQLTESPVNTIDSITERPSETESYKTLVENTDYALDKTTDIVFRLNKNWAKGVNSIIVTYNAGYSATPADLKLAVADLVTHYLKGEHKERRTIQGATIQNQKSDITFPDHIKRILDLYKTY
tara:strand:+ start:47 stop:604 length:558 start_codon:yes stop_codon:yes gene_type:complete